MSALCRPLVLAFLAFLVGLLSGLRFGPPVLLFALLTVALAGLALAQRHGSSAASVGRGALLLLFSLGCAGVALGTAAQQRALSDCRVHLPDGARVRVAGALGSGTQAAADPSRAGAPLLPLYASAVQLRGKTLPGCRPELRVRLPEDAGALRAGTEVRLEGIWMRSSAPVVASRWPIEPRLAGLLLADSLLAGTAPPSLRHPLLWLRGSLEVRLYRLFPRHAGLADALLLGRREGLDPALRQRFAEAGMVHLLAISGAHVGLITAALLLVGGALRLSRQRLSLVTIALVWLYLALIGAPPSAVRAGIMISLALLGFLLQRSHTSVGVVAAAAWLILAASPLNALDVGFQLSFAGVLGILASHAVVLRRLPAWLRHRQPWRTLSELVVLSAGAFALTAPIVAYHFQQLAPISIVANVPAIPLMGLALNGVLLALVTEPLLPPLGHLFADGAGLMLDLLDGVARWAAAVPGGHLMVVRPDAWAWAVAGAVLLLGLTVARALRPMARWAAASAVALAVLVAWPALARSGGDALELYFIDVGQGDAVALRTPADRWVLIDTGPRSERFDAGERRVLPFLRAHGVRRLEALLLTHPDADHIGGAPAVLRGIEVARLIDPGMPVGKPLYLEVLQTAEARGVAWSAGESGRTLEVDGVKFDFLWPDSGLVDGARDANDISLVVRVRYGALAVILPGDAPAAVEERLVQRHGAGLRAAILKLGHHGSATSTGAAWLDAVRPELGVISVGRRNRYGHPAAAVLRRLGERKIPIARTDRDGTVVLRLELAPLPRWSQTE